MKLLQMLKLTKLRKLLSRKPKEEPIQEHLYGLCKEPSKFATNEEFLEELGRKNKIEEALLQIMTDHREESGPMNPIPSFRGLGVSLGQLSTYPPTQVRNIKKCFASSIDDFIKWRSGYSDQTLETLLIERGADTIEGSVCSNAAPTVLITKTPGYARKVDGKYKQENEPGIVIRD